MSPRIAREGTKAMKPRILCVDDDPDVLGSLSDLLRPHFDVDVALGGIEGVMAAKRDGPYEVVLADLGMPVMDGETFLKRLKAEVPDTVRVVLTGSANLQSVARIVNTVDVFRLLLKPCPRADLVQALSDAVRGRQAKRPEPADMDRSARGCVQMLTEILAISDPERYGRALRLRGLICNLANACAVAPTWPMEAAALLSQLEGVVLPGETIERVKYGQWLGKEEQNLVQMLPGVIDRLLSNVPGLEAPRAILAAYNGGKPATDAPWGARALRLLLDYDQAVARLGDASAALAQIVAKSEDYDPDQLSQLVTSLRGAPRQQERKLRLQELRPGMVLAEDVFTSRGRLLIARGIEVTPQLLSRLRDREPEIRGIGFKILPATERLEA